MRHQRQVGCKYSPPPPSPPPPTLFLRTPGSHLHQEVGACPKGDHCGYDSTNKLPYCYGPKKAKRDDEPWCPTAGAYTCTADSTGIDVCNAQNQLVLNGACPDGTHCELLESANWVPFCVEN